jgi:hypothetical protein
VLESKADMQKRGPASPDDGDAPALTFAQPVAPAEVEEEDEEEEFPVGRYGGGSSWQMRSRHWAENRDLLDYSNAEWMVAGDGLRGRHSLWYGTCSELRRGHKKPARAAKKVTKMHQNEDPKKRPLLTAQQLQIMRRVPNRPKKGNPREEFEKLFRPPTRCQQT